MTNKARLTYFILVLLFSMILVSCGASRFKVPLELSPGQKIASDVRVASVTMETDAAYLIIAEPVYHWGKFDSGDLQHLEQSLSDTISPHLQATSR